MSRIGKKPIAIPAGVEVKVDGSKVTVKGPKGTLESTFNHEINIALEGNEIIVTRPTDDKNHRALHGLTRTLIHNMVEGVTNGYSKTLEVNGVLNTFALIRLRRTLLANFRGKLADLLLIRTAYNYLVGRRYVNGDSRNFRNDYLMRISEVHYKIFALLLSTVAYAVYLKRF